jgi:hypothetical protein
VTKRLSLPLALLFLLSLVSIRASAAIAAPSAHVAVALYQVDLHVTNDSSQTVRLNFHSGGDFSPSDPPALPPGASQTITMTWNPSVDDLYHHPDAVFELVYHVTTARSETVYAKFTVTATPGSDNTTSCSDQGGSWPLVLFSCQLDAKGYHPTAHLTLSNAPYGLSVTDPRVEWDGVRPTFTATLPRNWHGVMKLLDDFAGKTQVIGSTQVVDGIATWQPQADALAVGDHRIYAQADEPGGGITPNGEVRTSNTVTVSVVRARPAIRLDADTNTLTYGQSPVISGSTQADVTGRLEFYAATKGGCNGSEEPGAACEYMGNAPLVDGTAKLMKPNAPLGAGAHELFATFRGDDNYAESTSNMFPLTVERSPTPMSLDIDTNDGRNDSFLHPPSFIVTTPKGAAGTVLFFASRYVPGQPRNGCAGGDNGSERPVPGCEVFGTAEIKDGVATLALRGQTVNAGIYVVHAFYWGDADYDRGDSNTFQVGIPRSTPAMRLTASAGTATPDHPPSFTVVMPLAAQGSVTFYDSVDDGCASGKGLDAACEALGTADVIDGAAKLKASGVTRTPGRHFIQASYGGDANFLADDSNVVTVNVR